MADSAAVECAGLRRSPGMPAEKALLRVSLEGATKKRVSVKDSFVRLAGSGTSLPMEISDVSVLFIRAFLELSSRK